MLVSNLAHTEIKNLKNILLFGTLDIIHDINMETSTVCNRRCSYCPNSIYDRGLEKNKKDMPFWLFKKIIDELSEINFEGRLSPHFFNEPLLDERIFTLIKYAITKLPKARIVLYTNGDFLTPITYNALIEAGVSGFVITSHEGKHNNNLESFLHELKENKNNQKVKIQHLRFSQETPLKNRGGMVRPKLIDYAPDCLRESNPLCIDFSGNVVLCCHDYLATVKFGNLEKEKIMDIWKKKSYKMLRKELKKRIYRLAICRKCVGQDNA